MGLRITGVKFHQHETQFIIGYAKAGNILRQSRIDEWSLENPEGYQREVIERRAREFGNFIARKGISPNAVLLNIRDADINTINKIRENEYEIPDGIRLWVVDGQHRLKGLEIAGFNHPDVLNINIPVVLMNLKSRNPDSARNQEATQFLIINKTQKGVRSDLAERLLVKAEEKKEKYEDLEMPTFLRRSRSSLNQKDIDSKIEEIKEEPEYRDKEDLDIPTFLRKNRDVPKYYRENFEKQDSIKYNNDAYVDYQEYNIASPRDYIKHNVLPSNLKRELRWKPRGVRISDVLNNRSDSPLQGKMKLPNDRPRGTTFSQVSMVSSLKNVLSTAPFSSLSDDELSSVLINIWKAVKELCPEPFQEVEIKMRADDYVLLKTTGIFVIPKLLVGLNPYLPRKNGMGIYTVEIFKRFLSRAGELTESDFWRSVGPETAGSLGTGQKSFSYISRMIIKRIITKGDDQGKQKVIL